MSAIVTNPATTSVGVRYHLQGTSSWTTIAAEKGSDGYTYTARATDFKPGKTYECQLLENDSESGTVKTAATAAGVQIPNAGFEEWHQSGNPWYPYAQGGEEFWGTGNPGSTSIGASYNITNPAKRSPSARPGQYCAKLQTTNVVIKKAAGNIFVGSFGEVLGTAGTVYMGRRSLLTPNPPRCASGTRATSAAATRARIFVCPTNMTKPGCTYHTVNTKSSEIDKTVLDPTQEFLYTNLNDPSTLEGHIIGYGDLLIEQSQSSWTSVDIPDPLPEQVRLRKPNVLILTASASYRGDYFEGSTDSNLYLDDIEFIYE
ncbi:MAG: PCMD domain-containing protein [Alistipes indistinctus]